MNHNKVALVFGGARGIGAAIAARLAHDGYRVAITWVSRPDRAQALVSAIDQQGGQAIAIKADSADAKAIQAAVKQMSDGGRVITIGSNTAVRTRHAGSSVYAMSKAAVASMVQNLALDLAPRHITINNIQPGPIATDMTADIAEQIVGSIPLQRMGQPDEIASLAAWLAGESSGYMTGASLTIDGGFVL